MTLTPGDPDRRTTPRSDRLAAWITAMGTVVLVVLGFMAMWL